MTIQCNIGGVYKTAMPHINIGGAWKPVSDGFVNIGGVWKRFFQAVVTNEYLVLGTREITGSGETIVEFTGLNIGKDEEVLLVCDIKNTTVSISEYSVFINGNVTATNYYAQRLTANGTGANSARTNNALMVDNASGINTLIQSRLKLTNIGYAILQHESVEAHGTSGVILNDYYDTTTFTATSITQIRVSSSVTGAIGVGSKITLYKIGGAS